MKPIRSFDDFIRYGVVKRQSPDKSRAEFLIKESEQDYSFLLELMKHFEITEKNANNFVKSCYDILMEAIRARLLLDGYNASGISAHEAEVSYMRTLSFAEKDVQFADQLRYFRNGMLYYGAIMDKEYAEKVVGFLNDIYPKLKEMSQIKPKEKEAKEEAKESRETDKEVKEK